MKKVYIVYPAGNYDSRLKTRSTLKCEVFKLWLRLRYFTAIKVDVKFTNAY